MSAQLEIKLIDASPSEQKALDHSLGTPQTPQKTEAPANTQSVAEASKAISQVNQPDANLQRATEYNSELGKTVGLFKQLGEQISDILGLRKKQIESEATPKPVETSDVVSPSAKKSIDSFKDLRKEISDLIGRHLPDAIGKPINTLFEKLSSTLGRLVPKSAVEAIEQNAFPAVKAIGNRVAESAIGKRVVSGVAGRAVAGAATETAGVSAVAAGGAGAAEAAGGAAVAGLATIAAPVAVAVAAIGALALAVYGTVKALHNAADDLEDYSPAISATRAQRDIRSEQNTIERANRIGGGVAQTEAAWNRFQDTSEKFYTGILDILVKAAPLIEAGVDSLTAIIATLNYMSEQSENILAKIDPTGRLDDQKEAAEAQAAGQRMIAAWKEVFETTMLSNDQLQAEFDSFMRQHVR